MIDIKEALKLKDKDLILAEIEERLKLLNQMVGTLYPSIMSYEICCLQDLWRYPKKT